MSVSKEEHELFLQSITGTRPINHDTVVTRKKTKTPLAQQNSSPVKHQKKILWQETSNIEIVSGEQQLFFARPGIQTRLLRKLRQGQLAIEARLDLHGLTIDEARIELNDFLDSCHNKQLRHLCIIHGKGTRSQNGTAKLKSVINSWLRNCDFVLAFCSAKPKDGGSGALYLLIKPAKTK